MAHGSIHRSGKAAEMRRGCFVLHHAALLFEACEIAELVSISRVVSVWRHVCLAKLGSFNQEACTSNVLCYN